MSKKGPKLDTMNKPSGGESPKLATLSGTKSKETLYIDVDDEITTIIEKVANAKGGIIALVLPKRAAVLQSVVNMRLLKRSAEDAGKRLVLVTSEAGLMPLAGLVGLHVADTPTSKPVIPDGPDKVPDDTESIDEPVEVAEGDDFDPDAAAGVAVGVLAGKQLADDATETVSLDDDASDAANSLSDAKPVKKDKKLKVPSFDKFRVRLVLGVLGVILLIVGWAVAMNVLPKSTIAIETDSSTVTSNIAVTLDTETKEIDVDNGIVPAVAETTEKTDTQQVPATGEKNNGDKATGTVKLNAQVCAPNLGTTPDDIPAGSSVTSNGHTYITQAKGKFNLTGLNGNCANYSTNSIDIKALKGGSEYNTGSSASFSGPDGTSGTGSADGGTDDIVKIVQQSDIDAAKAKIAAQDTSQVKSDLTAGLTAKGVVPVDATFVAGDQKVTSSANVGDATENVTVTAVTPYSMLGAKQSDLEELVKNAVSDKIDEKTQKLQDSGIEKAQFSAQQPASATSAVVNMKVKTVIGPDLDVKTIKENAAGKKAGPIQDGLKGQPGITDVKVSYSPFWVSSVPTNTEKITVKIDGQVKN